MSYQKLDAQSGLVYQELECRARSMLPPRWVEATTGSLEDVMAFRDRTGGFSLESMAIRVVLLHLPLLTSQVMKSVPWPVGQRLWSAILRFRLDSLKTWSVFAASYPAEFSNMTGDRKDHALSLQNSPADFIFSVKVFSAPSLQWITLLTIHNQPLSHSDVLNLSKMPNLGGLGIGDNVLSNRSPLRTWGRIAANKCAFLNLRVIVFLNLSLVAESNVLSHLCCFPSLILCGISMPLRNTTDLCGWTSTSPAIKTSLDLACFAHQPPGLKFLYHCWIYACSIMSRKSASHDLHCEQLSCSTVPTRYQLESVDANAVHCPPILSVRIGSSSHGRLPLPQQQHAECQPKDSNTWFERVLVPTNTSPRKGCGLDEEKMDTKRRRVSNRRKIALRDVLDQF